MAKLFRVWWTESDEGSGDRNEIARVKANSLDEAVKFARLKFLKQPFSRRVWYEDGDDMQAFVLHTSGREGNSRTEGLQIEQDDLLEPEFNVIDPLILPSGQVQLPMRSKSAFYDLTKPESIGMPLPRLKRFVLTKSIQVPKMKMPRVRM